MGISSPGAPNKIHSSESLSAVRQGAALGQAFKSSYTQRQIDHLRQDLPAYISSDGTLSIPAGLPIAQSLEDVFARVKDRVQETLISKEETYDFIVGQVLQLDRVKKPLVKALGDLANSKSRSDGANGSHPSEPEDDKELESWKKEKIEVLKKKYLEARESIEFERERELGLAPNKKSKDAINAKCDAQIRQVDEKLQESIRKITGEKQDQRPEKKLLDERFKHPMYTKFSDFLEKEKFGQDIARYSEKTNKTYHKAQIRKMTEDLPAYGLKKGNQIYIDKAHLDHIEVFDAQGNFLGVKNLDGSHNASKTLAAQYRRLRN